MSRLGRFVRRKWVERIVGGFFAFILLLIVGLVVTRYVIRYQGKQRLAEQIAKLDADDPRWRWEDIEADRPVVPEAENSAQLIPKIAAALGHEPFRVRSRDNEYIFTNEPPNRHMNDQRATTVREALAENRMAVDIAGQFRDYPGGRPTIVIDFQHPENTLQHVRCCDSTAMLIELDAEGQLLDGQPSQAISRVRPLLNLAKMLEGEPTPASQKIRVRALEGAARIVERSIAAGEIREQLNLVQSELLRDSQTDCYFVGVRGDRAIMHDLFERIDSGEVSWKRVLRWDVYRPDWKSQARSLVVATAYLHHNHAAFLEESTKLYAAHSLPDWKARAAIQQLRKAIQSHVDRSGFGREIISFGMLLRWGVGHSEWLRTKARLRCAAVALAVERFRFMNHRWPERLSDLPGAMLNEIPIDPFDGKPLRYVRGKDIVVVYSVGEAGSLHAHLGVQFSAAKCTS